MDSEPPYLPTVVVAESDRKSERKTSAVLHKKRLRVSPVRPKENLVEKVASLLPALVLLDFARFEKDLAKLLPTLRQVSPGSPVLMLVEHSKAARAAAAASSLGATDLLFEPFTASEFGYRVERCLVAADRAKSAAVRAAADRGEFAFSPVSLAFEKGAILNRATAAFALRDAQSGRLDAKRVAAYLDVPLKQFAKAVEENYKALHKTPSKVSLQKKLAPIERTIALLDERFRDRGGVRAWLNTPHPELGNHTGLSLVLEGKATTVSEMLEAAAAGFPS
jgi:DNA-binding response OmpR family regulator